jgi:glycosyltransferase involved in cell wall biosynthesis
MPGWRIMDSSLGQDEIETKISEGIGVGPRRQQGDVVRIVVLAERLRLPLDEGFKNTTIALVHALRAGHDVTALTTLGDNIPAEGVRNIAANRLLLSTGLWQALQQARPEIVLYVPTASATPAAMLRTRVLQALVPRARVVMLALQPRTYSTLWRSVVRVVKPRLMLVQSTAMAETLSWLGCRVAKAHSGVDSNRFAPVSAGERQRLRQELGLPRHAFIVLHAGHINEGRNVQILADVQRAGCQAVLLGSTSTGQDERLAQQLESTGVIVIRRFVDQVQEYYQAADCYIFPVFSDTEAIAAPLSVLEAMSCDLPVVTTSFGDLPLMFPPGGGLAFADSDSGILAALAATRCNPGASTRSRVLPYAWTAVAMDILETIKRDM